MRRPHLQPLVNPNNPDTMNILPEPPPPPLPSRARVALAWTLAIFGPWVILWRIVVHFDLWPR